MAVKKNQKNTPPRYLFWFLSLSITAFLFVTPYNEALFNGNLLQFENPIFYTILFGSLALLVLAISLFFSKGSLLDDPLPHLLVWLIPLSMFISSFAAASHTFAVNGIYIYLLLAAMFVLAKYLSGEKHGMMIVTYGLMSSGYVIVLFGFMNWFGDASFFGLLNWPDATGQMTNVYRDAVQIDSNGPRMASVFQYANTYASYLTALLFGTLYVMATTTRRLVLIISSTMLVPLIVALLLTLSRGGWATALLSFLIILIFTHLHKQILMLIYALIGSIVSVLIYNSINDNGASLREHFSALGYTKAWLVIAFASLAIVLLSLGFNKYIQPFIENKLQRFSIRKWVSLIVPFSFVIFVGFVGFLLVQDTPLNQVLPDNIERRVDNINFAQHSVLERATFYTDAWKFFKDYPVIGAGSGAWFSLYEKYQNNPYTSRQAHNFIMQHLTETGLLGVFILLVFLGLVFYLFIKRHYSTWSDSPKEEHSHAYLLFIIAISLFIHSLIDFDMSYVYIALIFFLCLGAMTANSRFSMNIALKFKWNKVYPILLTIISIVMIIGSSQLLKANSLFKEAQNRTKSAQTINDFMDPLDSALQIRPSQPDFILTKSEVLSQLYNSTKNEDYYAQNISLIQNALESEPYVKEYTHRLSDLFLLKNDVASAYRTISSGHTQKPWYVPFYEAKMTLALHLAEQLYEQGNTQEAMSYINDTMLVYQQFNDRIEHLSSLPAGQLQGNPFAITPPIALAVAKAYYYNGDYASSVNLLKPLLNSAPVLPADKEIARWYLAGLHKQGEDDVVLYIALTSADPAEIALLDQLALLP